MLFADAQASIGETEGKRLPASEKFRDPRATASGEPRAVVALKRLETLWFNTGTLCNLACRNCYIESSPKNDRLAYLTRADVRSFLNEARNLAVPPAEIGFTGGEPFMNQDIIGMLEDSLGLGRRVLVLTNAMKPMLRLKAPLLEAHQRFAGRLSIRVSLDHYDAARHEQLRGPRSWEPAINGLLWLARHGFDLSIAGRTAWGEADAETRAGYAELFSGLGLDIDASDPRRLVLFPEMEEEANVPEITEHCWGILGKSPDEVMCSHSRMVLKRKGAAAPIVVACTLLPYSEGFEMGASLAEAMGSVALNHPHCARFCVLGGATCGSHP